MGIRRLFERDYPRLVRFLYRRLGDQDQAEELAQEAFVRLLDRHPRRPRAWLYVVASNLARDVARGDARRTRHLQLLADERAHDIAHDPEHALLRAEAATQVRAALLALSERDRMLLLLRTEGLPYRDIAAVLGVSPTSIAPLLARAHRRFARSFQNQNVDRTDAIASG